MEKRNILITGGTSGIGLAAARCFLAEGCRVLMVGRSEEKGKQALQELRSEDAFFFAADLVKTTACKQVAAEAGRLFDAVDSVVYAAGIYLEKAIEDMEEEAYDQVMNVNIKGMYFLSKYMLPLLKKRAAASMVMVSSDAGVNGNYFCSAYCASKGAVTIFTKALALELACYNIRVNCVCPGDIDTPMTRAQLDQNRDEQAQLEEMRSLYPLGRIGTAEEVAAVICFLASKQASFVTGAAWLVDGGLTAS